jgi:hypothetical protein
VRHRASFNKPGGNKKARRLLRRASFRLTYKTLLSQNPPRSGRMMMAMMQPAGVDR